MAKILLVEDDNNLREIYEARLVAEGYEIVSARDGEEALSVAMKEKPDLIISDVMMPKISGFDMLDILRTTEETKHVKIIMMTALSQAEDKERAEKLGADRYLVKSQVTLEDVAKVAKEVLEGKSTPAPSAATAVPVVEEDLASPQIPQPAPATTELTTSAPVPAEPPTASHSDPVQQTIQNEEDAIAKQLESMMGTTASDPATNGSTSTSDASQPTTVATPIAPEPVVTETASPQAAPTALAPPAEEPATPPATTASSASGTQLFAAAQATTPTTPVVEEPPTAEETSTPPQPEAASATTAVEPTKKKVIEPINDLSVDMKPKLDELLAKEEVKESVSGIAHANVQQPGATTQGSASQTVTADDAPIPPPTPDTKIDPNSIAL